MIQSILKVKKSQSPDLNPIEHALHLLKTKLKAERATNKQQLTSTTVKSWQSITNEETWSLVMPTSSRLKAVIACKDSQQSIKNEHFIYDHTYLSNYIWASKNRRTVYKNGCNS